jgi:glycosyltransferase involved in cell wall biosynthesis
MPGWRRLFSLDSFLKICFIYCLAVAGLALISVELPNDAFDRTKNYKKITILTNINRMGEHQIFKRTMFGCKNLEEFKCVGIYLPEIFIRSDWTRHLFTNAVNLVNFFFKPDFNLLTTHLIGMDPAGYNVVYINVPYEMIMGLDKDFHAPFSFLKKTDAFLDLNYFSTGDKLFLDEAIKKNGMNTPVIPGILIIQNTEYEFAEPKNMILSGSFWGANRNSLRLSEALRRFGNEGKLFAYGPEKFLKHLEKGYVEDMSFSSGMKEDIIPLHKKHGISIAVHNFDHLMGAVPTTRIAESVAAGSIVISDNHPFIKQHFGDNVLYFDSFKSADEIYQEISNHLNWIKEHPDEVKTKTQNAHQIFMQNFSTEVQIPQIYDAIMKARML